MHHATSAGCIGRSAVGVPRCLAPRSRTNLRNREEMFHVKHLSQSQTKRSVHSNADSLEVAGPKALGDDFWILSQGEVHHATIGGMHGAEGLGASTLTDLVSCPQRELTNAPLSVALVVLAVHSTRLQAAKIGMHEPRQKMLEGAQGQAPLPRPSGPSPVPRDLPRSGPRRD